MSIISDIKCARCDRQYSGVRSRCPYCGARRIGSGKYSEEGDNSKGKMLIGVMLLALLVVAAGILLFTTPKPEIEPETGISIDEPETPFVPPEDDTIGVDGEDTETDPPEEPPEEPPESPEPSPRVESIEITYAGVPNNDFSESRGTRIPLRVRIEPAGIEFDEEVVWTSSDTSVFEVVKDNPEGTSAMVTIHGTGSAMQAVLTVSIDGVEAECIVRVKAG